MECNFIAGQKTCECEMSIHSPKFVVLTGGPGAGKTAVLELVRKSFCEHIQILPESASILFSGGFVRGESDASKKGAQRAIYHVQRELEQIMLDEKKSAVVLCDRGTLDGLAYWIGNEGSYFDSVKTSFEEELDRYEAVIHLRSPTVELGFNHQNPVRVESAEQAALIDEKIGRIWQRHPKYHQITSEKDFLQKAQHSIETIKAFVPKCCQSHGNKVGQDGN